MTNSEMLNEKIAQSGLKRNYIAQRLGITAYALSLKINNVNDFKSTEIAKMCDVLGIDSLEEKR